MVCSLVFCAHPATFSSTVKPQFLRALINFRWSNTGGIAVPFSGMWWWFVVVRISQVASLSQPQESVTLFLSARRRRLPGVPQHQVAFFATRRNCCCVSHVSIVPSVKCARTDLAQHTLGYLSNRSIHTYPLCPRDFSLSCFVVEHIKVFFSIFGEQKTLQPPRPLKLTNCCCASLCACFLWASQRY